MEQKRCLICGGIFLGTDRICRICRSNNPGWEPDPEPEVISAPPDRIAMVPKSKVKSGRLTVERLPFPTGSVHIPRKEDRDYRATIVITTPDVGGENFQFCKYRIDKYTPGEHRLVIVETHFNEKPYNYARDINIGFRGVKDSDYLVMLNDDVFVEEGWLDKLVDCAKQDSKIGIVGCLLLYPGKTIVQHAGGTYNTEIDSWASYGQMPVWHNFAGKPIRLVKDKIYRQKYVTWNTGALLLVTKECIDKCGLMDEKLIAHCDDVEYNFRAWLNGFKVVYCPEVVAVHRENVTRIRGTAEVPSYVFEATKHLMKVLPKPDADKVQQMVDDNNEQSDRPTS